MNQGYGPGEYEVLGIYNEDEIEEASLQEAYLQKQYGYPVDIVPYDKYIVPDEQGKTHYAFFSSTSKFMEQHFAKLAEEIETRFFERRSPSRKDIYPDTVLS